MRDLKRPTTSGHVFRRIHKGSGPARLIGQILEKTNMDSGRSAQTLGGMITTMRMGLRMECQDCGEGWTPAPQDLLDQFGPDTALSEIVCPCPACGSARVHSHPVSL